jgi:hypothetical protein
MPRFYSVANNSLSNLGFPWVMSIRKGLCQIAQCTTCNRTIREPQGDFEAILDAEKGTKWPDVLGCGHWPLLIVSAQVVSAWELEGAGCFPHKKVEFLDPLPRKLVGTTPPPYYWIDGAKLRGALIDFDASGFVGVAFCRECGTRSHNISATFKRQHSSVWPFVFRPSTWTGSNLFTTDISAAKFFCTDKLVEIATKYRFTNFRFIPVEEGAGIESKGLMYL